VPTLNQKGKIIVLGLNRSGTKLACSLIAQLAEIEKVFLEPFTWDRGISSNRVQEWDALLRKREISQAGRAEHERLSVITSGSEESSWLQDILAGEWQLYKFVEIGRWQIIRKYAGNALFVVIIRDPIEFASSVAGTTLQKEVLSMQWKRLVKEHSTLDPLPDADTYLEPSLADSLRLYCTLYKHLDALPNERKIVITYDELLNSTHWQEKILTYVGLDNSTRPISKQQIGISSKEQLTTDGVRYITEIVKPLYRELSGERICR
jgi:hypothetical protein